MLLATDARSEHRLAPLRVIQEVPVKAIVQDGYGPLEVVLRLQEVDEPAVADGEVLVRVHAASIHVGDTFAIRGVPYLFRPMYGLRKPKERVPGTDMAGTVEAVASNVTRFSRGDEVFGWGKGAFAERIAVPVDNLLAKPARISFIQAAAVGVSAVTALQALRDHGHLQAGQKVLVNGASGGVGTFAVQIAKSFDAEVTGVCSTRNVELVRSIGADAVIDYTAEDFTEGSERFDLILDNVANHPMSQTRRVLTRTGTLLSNGAPVGGWTRPLGHFARAALTSIFVRQQGRPFDVSPNREDLATLMGLVEDGKVKPVIDRTYPLSETAEAVAHVVGGHTQGTTVIVVSEPPGEEA